MSKTMPTFLRVAGALILAVIGTTASSFAANWSVVAGNALTLDSSASGLTIGGMSGVSYLGPSPEVGKHRFLTVQDSGAGVVTFDVELDLNGTLLSAEALSNQALSTSLDFEGITMLGDSLYLSDEDGPGVREFDLSDGSQLQSVAIPAIFSDHKQANRGFEALTYDSQQSVLWTANEEALAVDGSLASAASGTTVRLLQLEVSGDSVVAGSQFAYQVDPIHGSDSNASTRSGLVEMVSMPDGTLVAMERSLAAGFSAYQARMYEVTLSGATDVSVAPWDEGLAGETYVEVGKELIWSGTPAGGFGQNLEGLALGPRLPNGDWVLLGVVDDGGASDFLSGNTILAFTASPTMAIPFADSNADFDADGDVDGQDLLAWQRGAGVSTLAGSAHGDANHDGMVDAADLAIWQTQYAGSVSTSAVLTIPEPTSFALAMVLGIGWGMITRRGELVVPCLVSEVAMAGEDHR